MTKPKFQWIAHYEDGTFDAQAEGAVYNDIRRDDLIAFDLCADGQLFIRVDLRPIDDDEEIGPRRLIWRRRATINNHGQQLVVYMIGWQRAVKGRSVQAINYVTEDGAILLGGQFTDHGALPMDSIQPLPCEQDLMA